MVLSNLGVFDNLRAGLTAGKTAEGVSVVTKGGPGVWITFRLKCDNFNSEGMS